MCVCVCNINMEPEQQKAKCEEEEEEEGSDEKQNADNNTSSSQYGEVTGKLEDKSCLQNKEASKEGHRPKGGQTMNSHSLAERVCIYICAYI